MEIAPGSQIKLLKGVPLDTHYKHCMYYPSKTAQYNDFSSYVYTTLVNQSYQRVDTGRMCIQIAKDNITDCNYVMFQNTPFGNKWWYAFITGIEYSSNETSYVYFEIDVMSTWLVGQDYILKESFVVREHSATDAIGDNLLPENVELGEYVFEGLNTTNELSNCGVLVSTTEAPGSATQDYEGGLYNGIFSGVGYYFYVDLNIAAGALTQMEHPESVIAVTMYPSAFLDYTGVTGVGGEVNKSTAIKYITYTANKNTTNIGGYTPRNKKLFTYPYNFLYITNFNGNSAEMKYEYFSTNNCVFRIYCDVTPNPTAICVPLSYKGIETNFNEKLTLTGWPQCAWSGDLYKAYLAQNGSSMAVSMLSSALSVGAGIATGNPMAIVGGGLSIASTMAKLNDLKAQPPQAHGSPSSVTNLATGTLEFGFSQCHCQEQFLACIDDYFDVEGYATHRVKVPNVNSRPYWNYTKTIDCNIDGSVPSGDMAKIVSIYNNGVTHWKSLANVGNYSLNNAPA